MKEHGILFTAKMVRAILESRKTETRRIPASLSPINANPDAWKLIGINSDDGTATFADAPGNIKHIKSRFGGVGSRLWVRETWRPCKAIEGLPLVFEFEAGGPTVEEHEGAETLPNYNAQVERIHDWFMDNLVVDPGYEEPDDDGMICGELTKWKPSIHMPRWASRIDLERTIVRWERLHDMNWIGAVAEGIKDPRRPHKRVDALIGCVAQFAVVWESIHGPGSWDANPWVEVVGFKKVATK